MNYWETKKQNAERANQRTLAFEANFTEEMTNALQNTEIWGMDAKTPPLNLLKSETKGSIHVALMSTTEAIYTFGGNDCVVLNFASYKKPGGYFLEGSCAQEESLCHESWLYNILVRQEEYYSWNKQHLNRGLYQHRALYTPDIHFEYGGIHGIADVLTCAAPNRSIIEKGYNNFTEEENIQTIQARMFFIRDIVASKHKKTLILGAWGCGVFKQDPKFVAELIRDTQWENVENVIVAVIDKPTYGIFKEVLTQG